MVSVLETMSGLLSVMSISGDVHVLNADSSNIIFSRFCTLYHFGISILIEPWPSLDVVKIGVQEKFTLLSWLESPRYILFDVILTFAAGVVLG